MKYVIVIVGIIAVVQGGDQKQKAKQLEERYEDAKHACATKLDLTSDEVSAMEMMRNPETSTEKCWTDCILSNFNMMVNGKFSREKSDEFAAWIFEDDQEKLTLARDISKRCEKEVEAAKLEDACDIGAEVFRCAKRAIKQLEAKFAGTDY